MLRKLIIYLWANFLLLGGNILKEIGKKVALDKKINFFASGETLDFFKNNVMSRSEQK